MLIVLATSLRAVPGLLVCIMPRSRGSRLYHGHPIGTHIYVGFLRGSTNEPNRVRGRGEGCMSNGQIAGRMSTLRILSAAGKDLTPGALPLAILGALTVNVYPRWSPSYPSPIGLLCRAALFTTLRLAQAGILESGPVSWMRGLLAAHRDHAGRLSGPCTRRLVSTLTVKRKPYGLASVAHLGPDDSP